MNTKMYWKFRQEHNLSHEEAERLASLPRYAGGGKVKALKEVLTPEQQAFKTKHRAFLKEFGSERKALTNLGDKALPPNQPGSRRFLPFLEAQVSIMEIGKDGALAALKKHRDIVAPVVVKKAGGGKVKAVKAVLSLPQKHFSKMIKTLTKYPLPGESLEDSIRHAIDNDERPGYTALKHLIDKNGDDTNFRDLLHGEADKYFKNSK